MEYAGTPARSADGAPLPVSHAIYAANKYIGGDCFSANKDFLTCKQNDANPSACLREGERVRACVAAVLKSVDGECPKQLTAYAKCIHKNDNMFQECRMEQAALEKCRPPPSNARPPGSPY